MRLIDEEFAARSMFGGLTASGAHTFARGQLTAGIAHEIKNPLNFINNLSALSVELVDELDNALKPAALDNKTRKEIDELTHILKGNLEKVVQHSKRASRACARDA